MGFTEHFCGLGLLRMFLEHLDLVFLIPLRVRGFFWVWRHVDMIHAEARENQVLSGKS